MKTLFRILTPLLCAVGLVLMPATDAAGRQRRVRSGNHPRPSVTVPAPVNNSDSLTQTSPGGKLVISGAHAGLHGILNIHADASLQGPIAVSVVNGAEVIPQGGADDIVFELSRRTDYSVELQLAEGRNVVEVKDRGNSGESATLTWSGVAAAPAVRQVAVVPARAPSAPSGAVASPSHKLVVVGLHNDEQGIVSVTVDGSLNGPFKVSLADDKGKALMPDRQVELKRGENSFQETLRLAKGKNIVTVSSTDGAETAEVVTLPAWEVTGTQTREQAGDDGPGHERVPAFTPNSTGTSREGNITAEATRVNGSVQLKVHLTEAVSGFSVESLDSSDRRVESKSFPNLQRGYNDWSVALRAAEGVNKVIVTALNLGDRVELSVPAEARLKPAETTQDEPPEYDWGRVRGYFSGGVIFSKERDNFSKSDIFLDFTLDKNYVAHPFFKGVFKDLNTFFDARLTSIPVAAPKDSTTTAAAEGDGETCNTPDCTAFISSQKAALMQAGVYLPMYWHFTSWYRRVPRPNGFRWEKNALFVAPLAKGGILTVTGDTQTAEARRFGRDDVFNFFSFGLMLGHYRLHMRRKMDDWRRHYATDEYGKPVYESDPNIAPELISWLTLSRGRWENFEVETPTGAKDAGGNDIKWRQRPWRYEALGRLKIPETPFIVGFDGNFGQGPDDVRFIFGTRFDIGKVLRTIKVAQAQDNLGHGPAAAPTTPATPSPGPPSP